MSELERLRRSEERYRAFVQLSSEGIWCFELEHPVLCSLPEDEQIEQFYQYGFLVECNDAMARMYGLEAAGQLLGARLPDLLPHTDPANLEYLRAFIRSGYRLSDAESHERTSDGSSRYFLNNLTGVVRDGMILRAWGVQRDITEQKRIAQTEQSLRESEERFQLATRAAGIGTFDWQIPSGRIIWSEQEALLFGVRPEEFDGTLEGWARRVHPEDLEAIQSHLQAAMDRKAPEVSFAFRIRRPDHSIRWMEGAGRFLYAEDGTPVRMVGVNVDATARRQMDHALRESEARFRTMADSAPVLIWLADTSKAGIWFNRPWLEFRGRTLEQECAGGWMEGVHPEDFERCLKTLDEAFDAREPFRLEYRLRRHDGAWRWALVHGLPLYNADREFTGCIGSCVDITERKELEQELHCRLQELAEADRHKDEFLAMLSHELRNPLAGIANATYLLERTHSGSQLGELRNLIQRQTGYLSRLVDDLLDVSRLTRGLVELQLAVVNLGSVIEQAVAAGRSVIEARRHRLTVRLPEATLLVRADPIRLEQILLNLFFNAAKYTEPGGQIWVEVEAGSDSAVIRVRDTGVGIAPDLLPRVFHLFTQADKSYARTHGGLGIGLALVQRLVQLHEGEVTARSEGPGRGSEFEVRLPLVHEAPQLPITGETPVPGVTMRRRVLVIEDDRDAAETLRDILELCGHQVELAFTGPEGLAKARSVHPDVILCDIGLPGMDGWAVARELRAADETRNARLIALTGFGLPEDRRRTLEAGFDRHLTKPIDLPELERLVGTL